MGKVKKHLVIIKYLFWEQRLNLQICHCESTSTDRFVFLKTLDILAFPIGKKSVISIKTSFNFNEEG